MEAKSVCVYAKFGRCKNEECEYHHPNDTCCDQTCNIHNCSKKHPRHCRYFWGFNACRNTESCKFLHKTEATQFVDVDKYKDLEEKYLKLEEKYSKLEGRHSKLFNEMVNMKVDIIEIRKLGQNIGEDMLQVMGWQHDYDLRHYTMDGTLDSDDEKEEESQMSTEVSSESQNDINNVSDMEEERNDENDVRTIALLSNNTKPSKHLPKNDFHNVNYVINEVEIVRNMIVNETMTKKRVTEVKQQIKTLRNKMSLKFTKNKDSDTETFTNFEKVCKKLETTPFKNFKTIAKIELKEFLEKSKEQIKLKK